MTSAAHLVTLTIRILIKAATPATTTVPEFVSRHLETEPESVNRGLKSGVTTGLDPRGLEDSTIPRPRHLSAPTPGSKPCAVRAGSGCRGRLDPVTPTI